MTGSGSKIRNNLDDNVYDTALRLSTVITIHQAEKPALSRFTGEQSDMSTNTNRSLSCSSRPVRENRRKLIKSPNNGLISDGFMSVDRCLFFDRRAPLQVLHILSVQRNQVQRCSPPASVRRSSPSAFQFFQK